MPDSNPIHVAMLWFLSARTMSVAGEDMPSVQEAATGLYAQAILGFDEDVCKEAKEEKHIGNKSLIDCLSGIRQLPSDIAEKILTGVMMISYADRKMKPLEVRWASMLASAIEISPDDFQRCCVNARVIASMLRPHGATS